MIISPEIEKINQRITDLENKPVIDGLDGMDGKNGVSPILGVDYWTQEDRTRIIEEVISKIPKGEDGINPDINDIVSRVMDETKKQPIYFKDIKGTDSLIQYLKSGGFRGGGDTITAGTNITIDVLPNGVKQINSTGGGGSQTLAQVSDISLTQSDNIYTLQPDVGVLFESSASPSVSQLGVSDGNGILDFLSYGAGDQEILMDVYWSTNDYITQNTTIAGILENNDLLEFQISDGQTIGMPATGDWGTAKMTLAPDSTFQAGLTNTGALGLSISPSNGTYGLGDLSGIANQTYIKINDNHSNTIFNGTKVSGADVDANSAFPISFLGSPGFTGTGDNDMEWLGAYTPTTSASFNVTIDGGQRGTIAYIGASGPFTVGEIITDIVGMGTGTTATVVSDDGMGNLVYNNSTSVNGGFAFGDSISGSLSSSTATVGGLTPDPDTFSWTEIGGTGGSASGVAITAFTQILIDGVDIIFAAQSGHNLGDNWIWNFTIAFGRTGELEGNAYNYQFGDLDNIVKGQFFGTRQKDDPGDWVFAAGDNRGDFLHINPVDAPTAGQYWIGDQPGSNNNNYLHINDQHNDTSLFTGSFIIPYLGGSGSGFVAVDNAGALTFSAGVGGIAIGDAVGGSTPYANLQVDASGNLANSFSSYDSAGDLSMDFDGGFGWGNSGAYKTFSYKDINNLVLGDVDRSLNSTFLHIDDSNSLVNVDSKLIMYGPVVYTPFGTPGLNDLTFSNAFTGTVTTTFTVTLTYASAAYFGFSPSGATINPGDTIVGDVGSGSPTGTVIRNTAGVLLLDITSGSFLTTTTFTDTTTGATGTIVFFNLVTDVYDFTDGTTTLTERAAVDSATIQGMQPTLATTGHTVGDMWAETVTITPGGMFELDGLNGEYSIGDIDLVTNKTRMIINDVSQTIIMKTDISGSDSFSFISAPILGAYEFGDISGNNNGTKINIDDANIRTSFTNRVVGNGSRNIASANALTLSVGSNYQKVSGTTTINTIATSGWTTGSIIYLRFAGALTIVNGATSSSGNATIQLDLSSNATTVAGAMIGFLLDLTIGANGTWQQISKMYP